MQNLTSHLRPRTLAFVLLAAALALAWPISAARAETGTGAIAVVGTGTVSAPPDTAIVTIGAGVTASTVGEANTRVSAGITAFLADIGVRFGVASANVRTVSYNIYPVYYNSSKEPTPFPSTPAIAGYRVEQILEVRTSQTDAAGDIIDAGIAAIGSDVLVQGVRFAISDPAALLGQARTIAVQNAFATAVHLAGLAGVRLGAVTSITESSGGFFPIPVAAAEGKGGVPGGTADVSVSVSITFSILP